mmetsp:Transcript_70941/g.198936  ORF Transcript_70941/g.198936 Transcript_70941/m.198936 type:complete len:223 (-) Transcript_70941:603-1271(-)
MRSFLMSGHARRMYLTSASDTPTAPESSNCLSWWHPACGLSMPPITGTSISACIDPSLSRLASSSVSAVSLVQLPSSSLRPSSVSFGHRFSPIRVISSFSPAWLKLRSDRRVPDRSRSCMVVHCEIIDTNAWSPRARQFSRLSFWRVPAELADSARRERSVRRVQSLRQSSVRTVQCWLTLRTARSLIAVPLRSSDIIRWPAVSDMTIILSSFSPAHPASIT